MHTATAVLAAGHAYRGHTVEITRPSFFDTITVIVEGGLRRLEAIACDAVRDREPARSIDDHPCTASTLDETVTTDDCAPRSCACSGSSDRPRCRSRSRGRSTAFPRRLRRTSDFMTHPVFHRHHGQSTRCCATSSGSRTRTSRSTALDDRAGLVHDEAQRDLGDGAGHLARVRQLSIRSSPVEQAQGYAAMFERLEAWLAEHHRVCGGEPPAQRRERRASTPG